MQTNKTKNALQMIDSMIGNDSNLRSMVEEATMNAHIAKLVYDARIEANLSQEELANLIQINPIVIEQIEDADYEGNPLTILMRIAKVCNKSIPFGLTSPNEERLTA